MKTDRFSPASIRAALLMAGLLLAAGSLAAQLQITINFQRKAAREKPSSEVAKALAQQVEQVQKKFDGSRSALRTVKGPGGEPVYPLQEVAGLIASTETDLDQAIERVRESGLEPLQAWSAEKLGRIRQELAAPAGQTAASSAGLFAPRAVAVVASLGGLPSLRLASTKAAPPKQETIAAEKSNRLLDQVGEVVGRIFFLAAHDDLEVKLWVGSTPAPRATFNFWSQGKLKGSTPAPTIIRTDSKREHVLRGLYSYRAAWSKGPVTELVQYPNQAGVSTAGLESERLDLVNGSSFFCCRFNEHYCHHVSNEKECRP